MNANEYISASEFARFVGKSDQTVYNMIKSDMINAIRISRGKSYGYIIEKPVGYDEWKKEQSSK